MYAYFENKEFIKYNLFREDFIDYFNQKKILTQFLDEL